MTDQSQPLGTGQRASSAGVPVVVWLLVAGALATAVMSVLRQGIVWPYLDLRPAALVNQATSTATFLLAAAVILGARRWSQGRSRLVAGAGLLALRGVLELGFDAWYLWWFAPDPRVLSDTEQIMLIVRGIGSIAALAAGFALLALGLWAARSRPIAPARQRRLGTRAIGALGIVAGAGGLGLVAASAALPDWPSVGYQALVAVQALSVAGLGIAALWCRPDVDPLPEAAISVGATMLVISMAWSSWFSLLVSDQELIRDWAGWVYTLPSALGLLGLVAIIIGFAIGRSFTPAPD